MTKTELNPQILTELSHFLQDCLENEQDGSFFQESINIIYNKFKKYVSIQAWQANADSSATLRAASGVGSTPLRMGTVLKSGEGSVARAIQSGKKDLSLCDGNPLLCIPLLQNGKVVSVLSFEREAGTAFDENEGVLLQAVASQVAMALKHRALYVKAQDFNKKLQSAVDEKTLELRRAHERILEQQKQLQQENSALKTLVNQEMCSFEIIGSSAAIKNILTMVDKVAPTTATVLLLGESGTGKELVAKRLHLKSERSNRPYVTINCGALQESLLESELFGHEKGSFTGAVSQKIGLCETVDGGTLFLDEIGELSLNIQAKLLRFLQEGEFYRIGGKRSFRVNVRVISATNRELEQEVKAGRFREDLFYRLNTITLRMPPLRRRKEDIPALVQYFLENSRFGNPSKPIKRVHPAVMEIFTRYDWPGNIRELQNILERLKILADKNEIRVEDIPFNLRIPKTKSASVEFAVDMSLEEVEKNHVLRILAFHNGNKTKTAQNLGITIKTLYNKLNRYGVMPPQDDFPADSSVMKS